MLIWYEIHFMLVFLTVYLFDFKSELFWSHSAYISRTETQNQVILENGRFSCYDTTSMLDRANNWFTDASVPSLLLAGWLCHSKNQFLPPFYTLYSILYSTLPPPFSLMCLMKSHETRVLFWIEGTSRSSKIRKKV